MRKMFAGVAALLFGGGAAAQTTTTNCAGVGYGVQCTSRTQPDARQQQNQNQENMNRAIQNIESIISAGRERRAQQRASEAQAAEQAEIDAEVAAANATAKPQLPTPTDELPVILACTVNDQQVTMALYEKHGRVDVTANGSTGSHDAQFKADAVIWTSALANSVLNRFDSSYIAYSNLAAIKGQLVWQGTCSPQTARRF